MALTKEQKSILDGIEKQLNKKFETERAFVRLGDKVNVRLPSICTDLPSLDEDVIGTGGIPRGRIIEVYGPESSGKTTICLHIIAQEQKARGLAVFIDAEHALDPTYASKLGVNMDDVLISQPDSGEQALDTAIALVESKVISLIVIDSVSALVPRAELEGDMGESHMGLQSRLMSQAMRKLRGICATNNVTIIFINQIREKIGVMFGNPETTTGGKALKFYASVRLDIRKIGGEKGQVKSDGVLIGHKTKIKAVKNKVGTPLRETEIDLIYGQGFDTVTDILEYAVKCGIIDGARGWYKYEEKSLRKDDFTEDQINSIKEEIRTQKIKVE